MQPADFINQYVAALASQKWENVQSLIHENAVVTFSSGAVHKGKAAIKKAYEHNFSLIKSEEYRLSAIHWVYKDESTAVYTFVYNWKGYINNQLAGGKGTGTTTLKKVDSNWLLLAEHLGTFPNS